MWFSPILSGIVTYVTLCMLMSPFFFGGWGGGLYCCPNVFVLLACGGTYVHLVLWTCIILYGSFLKRHTYIFIINSFSSHDITSKHMSVSRHPLPGLWAETTLTTMTMAYCPNRWCLLVQPSARTVGSHKAKTVTMACCPNRWCLLV